MKTHLTKNGRELPLRLICCFVLATTPMLSAVTACGSDATDQHDDAGTEDPPEVDLERLTGWMLLRRGPAPDPIHVTGEATLGTNGDTLHFSGEAPNGDTVWMNLQKTGPDTLQGTWTGPGGAEEPVRLTLDPASLGFAGTVGESPLEVNQAEPFQQTDTGVWIRRSDQATALFALDVGLGGSSALISILDEVGEWPEQLRYKGRVNAAGTRIEDSSLYALRYARGTELYACLWDRDVAEQRCHTFDRAPAQSPRNGVWMAGNKNHENLTEWSLGVIVEHGNTLYIHERDETLYDTYYGLDWALRAVQSETGAYRDTDHGYYTDVDWVGSVSPSETRITGRWEEWDEYYHSYDRLVSPADARVTGEASSLSVDWFDAPDGYPEPVLGNASVVLSGDDLTIVDQSSDGRAYRVDAVWTGYQFEGHWYDADNPEDTSPWRGQLLHGGWYLHGTWNKGEYSFLFFPILDPAAPPPDDSLRIYADPYANYAAVGLDSDTGNLTILHKKQDRLVGATITTQAGPVQVKLDERHRISSIVGPERTLTFHWASDSSSAELIDDDGTQQNTYTIHPDWSDDALHANINQAESESGRDLTQLRDWLDENPGRIAAMMSGALPAPRLDFSIASATHLKHGDDSADPAHRLISDIGTGVTLMTLGYNGAALAVGALEAGSLLGAIAACWAGGLLFVLGAIFIAFALHMAFECEPCTIACFAGCATL
ncbi:MAG: hypothetical protein ABI333_09955 [bacterium]